MTSKNQTETFGIYVHAPWCRYRCPYCAFNVYTSSNPQVDTWEANVLRDWKQQAKFFNGNASSLYVGGGTPSRIPTTTFRSMMPHFPLDADAEIGIELNPDDADLNTMTELIDIGFNRFSLGIQSLQNEALKFLGRQHNASRLIRLIHDVKQLPLRSWSMDLIFGLPSHIQYDIEEDLNAIEHYRPPHVSLYGLTIEPNTHFERQIQKGHWSPLDSDQCGAVYVRIIEFLSDLGYEHYEVSNFALPNHRSYHNEAIWKGGKYAGLGPGAHGFLPNLNRTVQHADWHKWTKEGIELIEHNSPYQQAIDFIITRLRHCDGFHLNELSTLGYGILPSTLDPLINARLIHLDNHQISLGPTGWPVADALSSSLIDRLRQLES